MVQRRLCGIHFLIARDTFNAGTTSFTGITLTVDSNKVIGGSGGAGGDGTGGGGGDGGDGASGIHR
jgi:hypothetical protein